MNPKISCVIRTYNEAKYIGQLIEALRSQDQFRNSIEIIVVDSGSTDNTAEILKGYGVKLIEILKAEFHFSKSLNLGIEKSTGDLIVILSAHSIPRENNWLQKMVVHFRDKNVAGVCCRQVPWPDADLYEVLRIEKTFGKNSIVYKKDNLNRHAMTFSNAASCIRRSVWEKHPFDIVPAAEDWEWANWTIENGYKTVYDAEAAVYHSHNESCRQIAQRLIKLERSADTRLSRKRNLLLTIKQALGSFIRGVKTAFSSHRFNGKKLQYSIKRLLQSFWYIVDFNRHTE